MSALMSRRGVRRLEFESPLSVAEVEATATRHGRKKRFDFRRPEKEATLRALNGSARPGGYGLLLGFQPRPSRMPRYLWDVEIRWAAAAAGTRLDVRWRASWKGIIVTAGTGLIFGWMAATPLWILLYASGALGPVNGWLHVAGWVASIVGWAALATRAQLRAVAESAARDDAPRYIEEVFSARRIEAP